MSLILYVDQDASREGGSFKKLIEQKFKKTKILSFQTVNAFKARLKEGPLYEKEIYILFAESKNRLKELSKLIDLMESKRIVLILPDNSEETITAALKFFPRFFTPISDTYNDLCEVLAKMIDFYGEKR